MNSAYRLYFNNRIVTKCWLQLAILLNYLILSAPPLDTGRVLYRGEKTLPELVGDDKKQLIRVDNIWAVTDKLDVAEAFAGMGGIVYQIFLPIGFPQIPVTKLGLSEEDDVLEDHSEEEYLLPATLDVQGLNRTLAYRIVGTTKHPMGTRIVQIVPEMVRTDVLRRPRSIGFKRPSLKMKTDLKVNRFIGEGSKEIGADLKAVLETSGNWHVWLREPDSDEDEDDEEDKQQNSAAILAAQEMTKAGLVTSHPALATLHKFVQLQFDPTKIQKLLKTFNQATHRNLLALITPINK